eukprot:4669896-Pyramimonas_sp.AAC.1
MYWVGRRESHESWERAVTRHFRALRHTRRVMRLYLGNAAPPAVREYREDSDGEILPLVGRDGLPLPAPAEDALQQDDEQ